MENTVTFTLSGDKITAILFVVANAAGITEYVNGRLLQTRFREASLEIGGVAITPTVPDPTCCQASCPSNLAHTLYQSRAFKQAADLPNLPTWQQEQVGPHPTYKLHNMPILRYSANTMFFTDGSCKTSGEHGQVIGAGVYRCHPELELKVNPSGLGASNTITRAELVAILAALQVMEQEDSTRDETIATDSLASMYMINKQLYNPALNRHAKHRKLLELIVKALLTRARAGHKTSIVKVKSHVGIAGNEQADQLANGATDHLTCDLEIPDGKLAYDDHYWVSHKSSPDTPKLQVNDLCAHLKRLACETQETGTANDTVYTAAWKAVDGEVLGMASNKFFMNASIPVAAQINALKYRYGQLWTKRKAFLQRCPYLPNWPMARNDKCPLCGEPDSGAHLLGGCLHRHMRSLYIHRHNQAMQKVLKAVTKGHQGNYLTFADVGPAEELQRLDVQGSRVPACLLPDKLFPGLLPDQVVAARNKLRPDILVVGCSAAEAAGFRNHGKLRHSTGRRIWVVEGGYGSDTRYQDKLAEKVSQHKLLIDLLRIEGYKVEFCPVILGVGGTVYKSNLESLTQLGLERNKAQALISKLHTHAVTNLHTIVTQRRILEAQRHSHPG